MSSTWSTTWQHGSVAASTGDIMRQLQAFQIQMNQLLEQQQPQLQQQQQQHQQERKKKRPRWNPYQRRRGRRRGRGGLNIYYDNSFFFLNLNGSFKNHHLYKISHQLHNIHNYNKRIIIYNYYSCIIIIMYTYFERVYIEKKNIPVFALWWLCIKYCWWH